jgi:hypothetical protein
MEKILRTYDESYSTQLPHKTATHGAHKWMSVATLYYTFSLLLLPIASKVFSQK